MKIESHWIAAPAASLAFPTLLFHHCQLQSPTRDFVRAVAAHIALQMVLASAYVAIAHALNFDFARVVTAKGRTLQTILTTTQVASPPLNLDEVGKRLTAFLALGHDESMMQGDGFEPP